MNITRTVHCGMWAILVLGVILFVWKNLSYGLTFMCRKPIWNGRLSKTKELLLLPMKKKILSSCTLQVKQKKLLRRKTILYWNDIWEEGWGVGFGNEPFRRLKCEEQNCELTDNKAELQSSDAVLFNIEQLQGTPPQRNSSNQRWIFWMLGSPGWSSNLLYKKWNGQFNWTMTYRLDSDIRIFYGEVRVIKSPKVPYPKI